MREQNYRILKIITAPDAVTSVAFGRDGHRIASGGASGVQLRNAGTGQPIGGRIAFGWVEGVSFSPEEWPSTP